MNFQQPEEALDFLKKHSLDTLLGEELFPLALLLHHFSSPESSDSSPLKGFHIFHLGAREFNGQRIGVINRNFLSSYNENFVSHLGDERPSFLSYTGYPLQNMQRYCNILKQNLHSGISSLKNLFSSNDLSHGMLASPKELRQQIQQVRESQVHPLYFSSEFLHRQKQDSQKSYVAPPADFSDLPGYHFHVAPLHALKDYFLQANYHQPTKIQRRKKKHDLPSATNSEKFVPVAAQKLLSLSELPAVSFPKTPEAAYVTLSWHQKIK